MEAIIAIIVAVLGLLFFKRKSDKAEVEKKLVETRAKDQVLKETQDELNSAIEALDQGIAVMKAKQEAEARKRVEDNMSLKERADRIRKNLK